MPDSFTPSGIIKQPSKQLTTIGDFPGTPFEKNVFVQFKSAAILAINSVFSKKEERLDNAVAYYDDFIRSYPDSEFMEQTNSLEMISRKKLLHLHPIKNTVCRLKILMHQIQR